MEVTELFKAGVVPIDMVRGKLLWLYFQSRYRRNNKLSLWELMHTKMKLYISQMQIYRIYIKQWDQLGYIEI